MNFYDVIEHSSLDDTIRLKLAHETVREMAEAPSTLRSRRGDTLPVPTSPTVPATTPMSRPPCST